MKKSSLSTTIDDLSLIFLLLCNNRAEFQIAFVFVQEKLVSPLSVFFLVIITSYSFTITLT